MNENILYIIRGLPGSGKSTLASKMAENLGCNYWEADMYFIHNGEYVFIPSRIKNAHAWCRERVLNDISNGKTVIVSNTFTQSWEMEDYIKAAIAANFHVVIVECTDNFGSIHGVPEDKIEQMRKRFVSNDKLPLDYIAPLCHIDLVTV